MKIDELEIDGDATVLVAPSDLPGEGAKSEVARLSRRSAADDHHQLTRWLSGLQVPLP